MIKRNNKKGFTIVELVIVIAVIAILAAVLIPTFSSIIKKANLSADQQAVRQMNTALAADGAAVPTDIFRLHEVLSEMGMNSEDYHPLTKDTMFFWDAGRKCILHVDKDYKIIAPAEFAGQVYNVANDNWYSLTLEIKEEEVAGVEEGQKVTVENGSQMQYVVSQIKEKGIKNIEIDLNGNVVDMMGSILSFPKIEGSEGDDRSLTISNGTIKNAAAVDYAAKEIAPIENFDGAYFCGLIPSVGVASSVTIKDVVFENINVKNTEAGNVALLVGCVSGPASSVTIENVTIKNSSVIGHRSVGALVGFVDQLSTLTLKGNIVLDNVDVQTISGRSGMLVGNKSIVIPEGYEVFGEAKVVTVHKNDKNEDVPANIIFKNDCSYSVYKCEQNKNGTDLKYNYTEKALVMIDSNTPMTDEFFGANVTGWNN